MASNPSLAAVLNGSASVRHVLALLAATQERVRVSVTYNQQVLVGVVKPRRGAAGEYDFHVGSTGTVYDINPVTIARITSANAKKTPIWKKPRA